MFLDKTTATIEDYFIIFTNTRHKHWLLKRLRNKFQHVFAVKKSAGGEFWIVINPIISHTHVSIVPISHYPTIGALLFDPANSVVIPVTAKITDNERYTLCVFNCVEVIKSLLGIRAFWTWTPYQLYRYLKKGGGNGRQSRKRVQKTRSGRKT